MRICLVSRELAPFYGGGIGTYVSAMSRTLAGAGHEVHVLTRAHKGLTEGEERDGVHHHLVSLEQGPAALDAYAFPQQRYAVGVLSSLEALHAEHSFDAIEFPDFWGEGHFALRAKRLQGKFAGAVMAVRLHTPSRDVHHLNKQSWLDAETAYLYHQEETSIRDADLVLSPTTALLQRVRDRLGAFRAEAVVRHPLDVGLDSARRERRTDEVLYFGRLELRKGVHLLVDAAVRLLEGGLDARFRFIGDDTDTGPFGRSMRGYLDDRIPTALRERFAFEPSMDRERLGAAIRSATVCCFPSLWENFPNVCLEAMALGTAVVAADDSGMAEIIEDGQSGLLFRAGDATSLAEALAKALGSPELRARLQQSGPARIRSLCDPKRIVADLIRALEGARGEKTAVARPRSTPAVTVLVPHHNLGRFLPETLQCLERQTFQDFETLVIDDGSTEPESLRVLGTVERPGRRVLRKARGGVSSARNVGLREAKGHWILPLDADDIIAPTFIEQMVRALEREPSQSCASSFASFFDADPIQPIGGWIPWGIDRNALPAINTACTCALLPTSLAREIGGWDEWMPALEDWDFYCSLAERGGGVVVPEFLYHYRIRPESLARTEAVTRRYRLISYLMQKHPRVALDPSEALRIQLAQTADGEGAFPGSVTGDAVPLRYRLVDGLNDALKRLPGVHPLLKRALGTVNETPDASKPGLGRAIQTARRRRVD